LDSCLQNHGEASRFEVRCDMDHQWHERIVMVRRCVLVVEKLKGLNLGVSINGKSPK
jgi:hypothetical protein